MGDGVPGLPGLTVLRAVEVEQNWELDNVNAQQGRELVPVASALQAKEQLVMMSFVQVILSSMLFDLTTISSLEI